MVKFKVFFCLFCLFFFPKFVFGQINPVYDNPGQGVFQCHQKTQMNFDFLKGGGVVVNWRLLQPTDANTLNQAEVQNLINKIKQDNKKTYLHFDIYQGRMPDWVQSQIGLIQDSGNGINPQTWDSRYQEKLRRYLRLFNQALNVADAKKYIEYIEPAAGGKWAGTDLWMPEDQLSAWATAAGCGATDWACLGSKYNQGVKAVLEIYLEEFPDLGLAVVGGGCRFQACDFTDASWNYLFDKYGLRVMHKSAGLGHPTDEQCGLRVTTANRIAGISRTIQEAYGTSIGCPDGSAFGTWCGGYETMLNRSLAEEKISYYCIYTDDLECRQNINRAFANRIGAQISIPSFDFNSTSKRVNENLNFSVNWRNDGNVGLIAPLKRGIKWERSSDKLFVDFVSGGVTVYSKIVDLSPETKNWPAGGSVSTAISFSVPGELGGENDNSSTTYRVYIGLTDPNNEGKRFALKNTDARNDLANRRYLVNENFTVTGKRTVSPTGTTTSAPGNWTINTFFLWRNEFLGALTTKQTDFDGNNRVDIYDFFVWRRNFLAR